MKLHTRYESFLEYNKAVDITDLPLKRFTVKHIHPLEREDKEVTVEAQTALEAVLKALFKFDPMLHDMADAKFFIQNDMKVLYNEIGHFSGEVLEKEEDTTPCLYTAKMVDESEFKRHLTVQETERILDYKYDVK
jgi:hypothetical protein